MIDKLQEEWHIVNVSSNHLKGCNSYGSLEDDKEANEGYDGGEKGSQNLKFKTPLQ